VEEIREYLGCDSLAYLSMEGLMNAVSQEEGGFCTACFSAHYPVLIEESIGKFQHEDAASDAALDNDSNA